MDLREEEVVRWAGTCLGPHPSWGALPGPPPRPPVQVWGSVAVGEAEAQEGGQRRTRFQRRMLFVWRLGQPPALQGASLPEAPPLHGGAQPGFPVS